MNGIAAQMTELSTDPPLSHRVNRRHVIATLLTMPLLGSVPALGSELDFLNLTVDDPISDPLSLKARLFLGEVVGRDSDYRKRRGQSVLEATEGHMDAQPDDTPMLMVRVAAFGVTSRASSLTETVAENYLGRSRGELDELFERLPEHPWRMLFDGFWHLEAVRRVGRLAAGVLGASVNTGVALLEQAAAEAIEKDQDSARAFSVALTLLSFDSIRFAEFSSQLLKQSHTLADQKPEGAITKVIVEPAETLISLLESKDYDATLEKAVELL